MKTIIRSSKNIVLIITIVTVLILNAMMLINPSLFQEGTAFRISIVLNFIVTFIFTWIFSEISLERTFDEKHKVPAIRSYRQTKTIGENIKYLISDLDRKIKLYVEADDTKFSIQLREYRNLLYVLLVHVNNIKLDWGDVVKDISKLNELEFVDKAIETLSKTEEFDEDVRKEITELKNKKDRIISELDENLLVDINPTTGRMVYTLNGNDKTMTYLMKVSFSSQFDFDSIQHKINESFANAPLKFKINYYELDEGKDELLLLGTCRGDLNKNTKFIIDGFKNAIEQLTEIKIITTGELD